MKIYTYYEDINFKHQDQLLHLWETSWKNSNVQPIILGRQDAEKHPYYQAFVTELQDQQTKIKGEPLRKYGLSCWLRWMAYATQEEEYFYVSDYDVINVNKIELNTPSKDIICLIDDCCPCFATGSPRLFDELLHLFISITNRNLENIIDTINTPWYHDQEFFTINRQYIIENLSDKISITRNRSFVSPPTDRHEKKSSAPIIHFSHRQCKTEENRIKMIKEFLQND